MDVVVLLTVAAFLAVWPYSTLVQGQAPGDEDTPTCSLQGRGDNVKVLLDSYHYEDLIGAGQPWATTGVWMNSVGGQCNKELMSCSGSTDPQDNWLFTQHISKAVPTKVNLIPVRVELEIQYSFSPCQSPGNPGGTPCASGEGAAGQQFGVYHYILNSPTPSARTVTSQYTLVGNVTDSNTQRSQTQTLSFTLSTDQGGFYIGFRDQGTCVTLERLSVFRYTGQARTDGLLTYPNDAPAPLTGTAAIPGTCAANSTSPSMADALVTINSTGGWVGAEECLCEPGLEFNSADTVCSACNRGDFKATLSNTDTCQPCPENSASFEIAEVECPCNDGFLRPRDMPSVPCSSPPSAPVLAYNVTPTIKSTSVEFCWLPPLEKGGREDLFYNIYFQEVDEELSLSLFNDMRINSSMEEDILICFEVTGLERETSYLFLVTAENGATDTVANITSLASVDGRYISIYITTEAGTAALSTAGAVAITFFVTLIVVAVTASVVFFLIWMFLLRK